MKDGETSVVNKQVKENSIDVLCYNIAMSNFYSKVLPKHQKRLPDMSFPQTNTWMNGKPQDMHYELF